MKNGELFLRKSSLSIVEIRSKEGLWTLKSLVYGKSLLTRENKFSEVLRKGIGGNSVCSIVFDFTSVEYLESLELLNLVTPIKHIMNTPKVNELAKECYNVHDYRKEVSKLKSDLKSVLMRNYLLDEESKRITQELHQNNKEIQSLSKDLESYRTQHSRSKLLHKELQLTLFQQRSLFSSEHQTLLTKLNHIKALYNEERSQRLKLETDLKNHRSTFISAIESEYSTLSSLNTLRRSVSPIRQSSSAPYLSRCSKTPTRPSLFN